MCRENPDGITWRVQKVLAAVGFKDVDEKNATDQDQDGQFGRGEIHAKRTEGLRRASLRDFHSFRVTWVTLALTRGVPLELVQKVTGHRTVEIVLKHYFQPGREEFRRALQSVMPKLLTNGHRTPKEEMLEILNKTSAKTWLRDSRRLRELVAALA
jgi:integrase